MTKISGESPSELELLLPWYVSGMLGTEDVRRIDAALKTDPDLVRSLELAREDRAATLELAEEAPLPATMKARFDAQLKQEMALGGRSQASTNAPASPGLLERAGGWLSETLFGGSNTRLAFAASAAALLILAQSGALISLIGNESRDGNRFDVASGDNQTVQAGTTFLAQIAPGVRVADLASFLESEGGRIVEGPVAGGLFQLNFDDREGRTADDLRTQLADRKDLFVLVLPGS